MPDNQAAPPASDTSAGSQTASPASPVTESLDDSLSRIYDQMQAPAEADKKADAAPAAPAEKDPAAQALAAEPAAVTQADTTEPEPIRAPTSWSPDNQKWFATLSRPHQEYIAKREAEAHSKITQQGQQVRAYEPVRQVYDEYRQWVPHGQEAEVTRNLLAAQAYLDQNPVDGLLKLAQVYNVTPAALAKAMGVAQPANAPAADPTQAEIDDLFKDPRLDKEVSPQLKALKDELFHVKQQLARQQNLEVSARQRAAEATVVDFAKDKPHWNDVKNDVAEEVELLKRSSPGAEHRELLQKAYDRAVWKNPEIRQRIQEDQRRADDAKAAKAAAEAKKLAAMNVRTGASASTGTFDGRWDDPSRLEALYDRAAGR